MAKAFSLVSWNVEHFKNVDARVPRVIALLQEQKPDVFSLSVNHFSFRSFNGADVIVRGWP